MCYESRMHNIKFTHRWYVREKSIRHLWNGRGKPQICKNCAQLRKVYVIIAYKLRIISVNCKNYKQLKTKFSRNAQRTSAHIKEWQTQETLVNSTYHAWITTSNFHMWKMHKIYSVAVWHGFYSIKVHFTFAL